MFWVIKKGSLSVSSVGLCDSESCALNGVQSLPHIYYRIKSAEKLIRFIKHQSPLPPCSNHFAQRLNFSIKPFL